MKEDLTFREAIEAATAASGKMRPITAFYPSAGYDTAPFMFLHDAFRRHRGAWGPPTPDLYVYVDMMGPSELERSSLTFQERRRGNALVVETVSSRALSIEGNSSSLLSVAFHSDVEDEERNYAVLRIRCENRTALEMCVRATWSPDVYVGVCDGCGAYGLNYRCENTLLPDKYGRPPFLMFQETPRWWVTDHFRPRTLWHRYASGDLIPVPPSFPFTIQKIALLSSRWGHPWPPLNGATSFEVRPIGKGVA